MRTRVEINNLESLAALERERERERERESISLLNVEFAYSTTHTINLKNKYNQKNKYNREDCAYM